MSRRAYTAFALGLLVVEISIALFVRDTFVRPHVGDALAVAFVYCALRRLTPLTIWPALAASLGIAFAIEIGQYMHVLDLLGLADNVVARTVLGYGFEVADFIAYAAGAACVLAAEAVLRRVPL